LRRKKPSQGYLRHDLIHFFIEYIIKAGRTLKGDYDLEIPEGGLAYYANVSEKGNADNNGQVGFYIFATF